MAKAYLQKEGDNLELKRTWEKGYGVPDWFEIGAWSSGDERLWGVEVIKFQW